MTSQRIDDRDRDWQKELAEKCIEHKLSAPYYNIASDRRNGRTAWTSVVIIGGVTYPAKNWYDGQYLAIARKDAAEVAYHQLEKDDWKPVAHQDVTF